jgi:hypothetical protein
MSQENLVEDICCPKFDPVPWNEKTFEWKDKKFIKDKVFTIFYIPVNYGSIMKKLDKKLTLANAENPQAMCLSDHTSMWNMDLYLAVDKEIPNMHNTTMSGNFVSKVYEGSFKETGNWQKDFIEWSKTKGYKTLKQFMWYTTCPKCVKKYGKNYVVILAEIEN